MKTLDEWVATPKSQLCPDCHHRPSMRCGDPGHCYCSCHDAADAALVLLASVKDMVGVIEYVPDITGMIRPHEKKERALAAIALAERNKS